MAKGRTVAGFQMNWESGFLELHHQGQVIPLTAEWLRQLSDAPDQIDHNSYQRFYDPTQLRMTRVSNFCFPMVTGITIRWSG
jgi:hypothetical protein